LARKIILNKDVVIDETKVVYNHASLVVQPELEDLEFFPMSKLTIPKESKFTNQQDNKPIKPQQDEDRD